MTFSGGSSNAMAGFNWQDLFKQYQQPGGIVGTETPEWDFPLGSERVPDSVRSAFLRSDAGPTGLNQFLQNADPKVIDDFRSAINMGIIRPKNAAASNITAGYGGLRAGDVAPGAAGVLGPMMNDMPSGMSPEYWAQANTLVNTMVNAQLKAAEQSGYLNGVPTVQREQIMQQLAQGWKQQFTNEFLAQEQKRSAQAQEGLSQQQINNQNLQAMAQLMGGTVNPQTGEFQQTEQGRQFDTTATGWINGQRTLAGQAQDWSQAKDAAAAASNPRDYIYAQMLNNARGGLAGQPATNQLPQPGQAPYTTGMPGVDGQQGYNPMQWTNPPGVSGAGTMAQNGTPGQPAPGQDGQLGDQSQWATWFQQAQQAQDAARQGMLGAENGPGAGAASALSPGPGSAGMTQGYPGYQGQALPQATPAGFPTGAQDGRVGIEPWQTPGSAQQAYQQRLAQFRAPQQQQGPTGWGQGQQGAGAAQGPAQTTQPQYTTSAFTQSLLQNRVTPKTGALNTSGQYMSQPQMQQALNLNKVRAQDYLRGNASEKQGFQGFTSFAGGYSPEDTESAISKNLPTFKAPSAGRMI